MSDVPFLHLKADRSAVLLRCCSRAGLTEIPLTGPRPQAWEMLSAEPLTIVPSVIVQPCGCHGRIRDGQWAPVKKDGT